LGLNASRVATMKLPLAVGTKVPEVGMKTPCPISTELPVMDGVKARVDRLSEPCAVATKFPDGNLETKLTLGANSGGGTKKGWTGKRGPNTAGPKITVRWDIPGLWANAGAVDKLTAISARKMRYMACLPSLPKTSPSCIVR